MRPLHLTTLAVASGALLASGCVAVPAQAASPPKTPAERGDWPTYGNDPGGGRSSPLVQISRSNVSRLRVAWTYRTGDIVPPKNGLRGAGFEATPIVVDGTMYLDSPVGRVIALDPEDGSLRWSYERLPAAPRTASSTW